jgi:dimethylglycine dehydrogenase
VLLAVEALDAEATGYEPVFADGRRVGYVTSGAYGHHVRQSLALAYIDREIADAPLPLTVTILGEARTARILAEPPFDPAGRRLRG